MPATACIMDDPAVSYVKLGLASSIFDGIIPHLKKDGRLDTEHRNFAS